MLTAHPLAEYDDLAEDERAALEALDATDNLSALALAPDEESRYALARQTPLSLPRVHRLMAVFELTALPGLQEDEARLLAWLGIPSIARLAELGAPAVLALQQKAHAPTMTRMGLTPLTPERAAELVGLAGWHPRFPRTAADLNAAADRRWADRPGARQSLLRVLRAGEAASLLAATRALRAELSAHSVRAIAARRALTVGVAERRAELLGASWIAACAALREDDGVVLRRLERRLRELEPGEGFDPAEGLIFALTVELSQRAAEAVRARDAALELSRSWRAALRRRDPARLADRVLDGVPLLELWAERLLVWPDIPLPAWRVREAIGGDVERLARARARWLEAWSEAALLVGSMITLSPLLAGDALSPDTEGARRRRRLARYSRPQTTSPWASDWSAVAEGRSEARLALSGELKPLLRDDRLILYSHDGAWAVTVERGGGVEGDALPPYGLTPAALIGAFDAAQGLLTAATLAELPPSWEQELIGEAARFAPLLPRATAMTAARAMPDALVLLHARASEALNV